MAMASFEQLISQDIASLQEEELSPVVVGILDSGIDATHEDLQGRVEAAVRVVSTKDELKFVECDPTRNNDLYGHGTGVASIIARIAPNTRFVDVSVLGRNCRGSGKGMLAGLEYAIDKQYPLINMSLAAPPKFAAELTELCERAYVQKSHIVASRRNSPLKDNGFPAELSSTISVDSMRLDDWLQLYYRVSHSIEFKAQGFDVVTAKPGGGRACLSGASFATPIVTAFCALFLGRNPKLTQFELKALLKTISSEYLDK